MSLADAERYNYMIRRLADSEQLYLLDNNGWVTYGDNNGNILLPIWPEEEFANLCAIDEWAAANSVAMNLEKFFLDLIPALVEQNIRLAIFPLHNTNKCIGVDSQIFAKQINSYLSEWYDDEFELPY